MEKESCSSGQFHETRQQNALPTPALRGVVLAGGENDRPGSPVKHGAKEENSLIRMVKR